MLRHTGAVCAGLGLLWFGPGFAQEVLDDGRPAAPAADDPLTEAWFDTVQSIGVLESLSRQLDVRRPGAIENLRRNTEQPMADDDARQARLDALEREIARLRSELALVTNEPVVFEPEPESRPHPRAPRVETRTTGLSDADRGALLEDALRGVRRDTTARTGAGGPSERPSAGEPPATGTTPTPASPWDPPTASGAPPTTPTGTGSTDPGAAGASGTWPTGAPASGGKPSGASPSHTPPPQGLPSTGADREAGLDPGPARGLPADVERRLAELEAELARLDRTGRAAAILDTEPPAAQPPAGADPADADLPTTLVLGPLEPTRPTGQHGGGGREGLGGPDGSGDAPGFSGGNAWNPPAAPATGGADPLAPAPTARPTLGPTDAGTLPIDDRVARAQAEAEARAERARQMAERSQHVPGYSADPVGQGRVAYLAGEYERAVALLARFPDRHDALYWQARALEKLERVPEALKIYERVAGAEEAGPYGERATTDLEFLRWKWEHNEAFQTLRESLEAKRKP